MTSLSTLADAMKARIEEIPELAGNVVVFSRCDIETEFQKRMAKAGGRCVVIRLLEARNESRRRQRGYYLATYAVSVITVPLLTQGEVKNVDRLAAEIEGKLQGWWPDEVPGNTVTHLYVTRLNEASDRDEAGRTYASKILTVETPALPLIHPEP